MKHSPETLLEFIGVAEELIKESKAEDVPEVAIAISKSAGKILDKIKVLRESIEAQTKVYNINERGIE